jgi:DNA-binding CsgD family transcriptional regulator
MGDVEQVRRALSAYDARRRSGSYLATRLAESYASAARSVMCGAAASNRKLLQMADTAGNRGHRALELVNLELAARTGTRGPRSQEPGAAELVWSVPLATLVEAQDGAAVSTTNEDFQRHEDVQVRWDLDASDDVQTAGHPPAAAGSGRQDTSKLSHREREVAGLISSGLSSAEVAVRLGISVNTVNAHLQRTYGKLGVSSRQDLSEVWKHSGDSSE